MDCELVSNLCHIISFQCKSKCIQSIAIITNTFVFQEEEQYCQRKKETTYQVSTRIFTDKRLMFKKLFLSINKEKRICEKYK